MEQVAVSEDVSTFLDKTILPDPDLDQNAKRVLAARYLKCDEDGNPVEEPKDLFVRVAEAIARPEYEKYEKSIEETREIAREFYDMMASGKWMPNSPTLTGAGTELGMLSACLVYPVEDTMTNEEGTGILDTAKDAALSHKVGAGTGFDFSKIRPSGDRVQSTNGVASGPVSFMRMYSDITHTMKQGGCFVGSTMIATANGPKPIKDLEQGDMVYSWDEEDGFVLRPCTDSWKTKEDAEVWDVQTDKGLKFTATPDHPIMKRSAGWAGDEVYREVQDLEEGDPLMPLTRYKKDDGWFISLHDGEDTRVMEHRWMAEQLGFEDEHIHHKDGDHFNNVPENLEGMSASDHVSHHMEELVESGEHPFLNLTEEQREKATEGYQEWFASLSDEQQSKIQSKRASSLNEKLVEKGEHNFITDPPLQNEESLNKKKRSNIAKSIWKVIEEGYEPTAENWSHVKRESSLYTTQQYRMETIEEHFDSFDQAYSYAKERNHRVVSAEPSGTEDVYNVEVPGTNNYVVCDDQRRGVVVSNTRRGANMGIMRVDHPDILEFINCKTEDGEIENFNISVAVTNEFMEKARNGEEYDLVFEEEVYDTLNASDVLDQIIENAHKNGEPGLFFVDRPNQENPIPHLGEICGTNPCGEVPLPPNGVCNLGHVNVSKYIKEDEIDWDGLRDAVHLGIHFLDNVIDENEYPLDKVRERSDKTRRIGLGVMGWADALINRDIPYDSEEAIEFADEVAGFIYHEAVHASHNLAEERGTFPAWDESEFTYRRRNSYVNTVAPTGTTSILGGTSGGIEPNYAFAFERHQADMKMIEVHDAARRRVEDVDDKSLSEIRDAVAEDPVLQSAHDIAPEWHIRHQAVWQRYTEQGVSKTINYSEDATPDDVREGYMLAYETGCKGITVYRDGSREGQALQMGDDEEEEPVDDKPTEPFERPDYRTGQTYSKDTPLGTLHVTINEDEDHGPFEVFCNVGKAGGSAHAHAEAIGRLISLSLRESQEPVEILEKIVEQLRGISSDRTIGFGENKVRSFPDGLGQLLAQHVSMNEDEVHDMLHANGNGAEPIRPCPDCSSEMSVQEGCEKCLVCGYSGCG